MTDQLLQGILLVSESVSVASVELGVMGFFVCVLLGELSEALASTAAISADVRCVLAEYHRLTIATPNGCIFASCASASPLSASVPRNPLAGVASGAGQNNCVGVSDCECLSYCVHSVLFVFLVGGEWVLVG